MLLAATAIEAGLVQGGRTVRISISRSIAVAVLLSLSALASGARAEDEAWPDIHKSVFEARAISENDGTVSLYVPEQAEDAAIVPVAVHIPPSIANDATTLTLIVDRNPAPVAATFRFGEGFRARPEIGERKLMTRIRVDSFSHVRAILETADGKLHMATSFVRGAGGCSAPASKDADEALANLGKMQVKTIANSVMDKDWREAVVMIRHPNFTGMQMDPISRGYTPARFVNDLAITRGADVVLRMEGGISISEDPNIRFNYDAGDNEVLEVRAADTNGAVFTARSDPSGS
jgi:sulfur-oxidizing protein SoxY